MGKARFTSLALNLVCINLWLSKAAGATGQRRGDQRIPELGARLQEPRLPGQGLEMIEGGGGRPRTSRRRRHPQVSHRRERTWRCRGPGECASCGVRGHQLLRGLEGPGTKQPRLRATHGLTGRSPLSPDPGKRAPTRGTIQDVRAPSRHAGAGLGPQGASSRESEHKLAGVPPL